MRAVLAGYILFVLAGCATGSNFAPLDVASPPDAKDWGPHAALVEWWYVSAWDPDAGLALHWALFRAWPPDGVRVLGVPVSRLIPIPVSMVHTAITDLENDTLQLRERRLMVWDQVCVSHPPLSLRAGAWRLSEHPDTGVFQLEASSVRLVLQPLRPPVVHPPGYIGTPETGRLAYQSITRLVASGTVAGRPFEGHAWIDHQWGQSLPGRDCKWDWCCLQAEDGRDIMLFGFRTPDGRLVQARGSVTSPDGDIRSLGDFTIAPTQTWTSPTGRTYPVAWRARGDDLDIEVEPLRLAQELISQSTCIAYWEGPVRFRGTLAGRRLRGHGMAETVGGFLNPAAQSEGYGVRGTESSGPKPYISRGGTHGNVRDRP